MSLSISERESAFLYYCLAYGGAVPHFAMDNLVIAAAISLGARDRMWEKDDPMPRHMVAAAVEVMLDEDPPPATDHDPTQAALEAYAEGEQNVLADLAAMIPALDESAVMVLRGWIASRRASAPKRGMTAADVLDRRDAWLKDQNDQRSSDEFFADLRRELEASR